MTDLDNLTPFGYDVAFAYHPDDRALLITCVAGRFLMPPAGRSQPGELRIAPEQPPPPMHEEFWGDPASTSLRLASQGAALRTRAEIYLQGSAWAERGRPAVAVRTRISVGAARKEVHAVGDRRWRHSLGATVASEPAPFTSMPLRYERAFGGTVRAQDGRIIAQEPNNPVGRGIFAEGTSEDLLPNLFAPGEVSPRHRQRLAVACYGPIPPHWEPRSKLAGTYDHAWVESRAPLWPRDVDERHFCGAAANMTAKEAAFRGGELVVLEGFSPDGAIRFHLPDHRFVAKSEHRDRVERRVPRLDGILLEPDDGSVTLYWRSVVPLGHGASSHIRSAVRMLETWESLP